MRTKLYLAAGGENSLCGLRQLDVIELVIGYHDPAPCTSIELSAGRKPEKARIPVHVVLLIPVVLSPDATVADNQRRRVSGPAPGRQSDPIGVQLRNRNRVLDTCVTVHDHRAVHCQRRPAFRIDVHPLFTRGLDHPLPGVPAKLVVTLHAEAAEGLDAPQMTACVLESVDERALRVPRAVENKSGGENSRSEYLPCIHQLLVAEDKVRRDRKST